MRFLLPAPRLDCYCACGANEWFSVFEHVHKTELKRAKDDGVMTAAQLETIVHPNEYFKRSYLLKNMDKPQKGQQGDVKMEG